MKGRVVCIRYVDFDNGNFKKVKLIGVFWRVNER